MQVWCCLRWGLVTLTPFVPSSKIQEIVPPGPPRGLRLQCAPQLLFFRPASKEILSMCTHTRMTVETSSTLQFPGQGGGRLCWNTPFLGLQVIFILMQFLSFVQMNGILRKYMYVNMITIN